MRILLVDNSKPHAAFFTPKLHSILQNHGIVTVCSTREQTSDALDERYDAIVLSGSSLNVSESLVTSAISKDLMVLSRFPDTAKLGVCFGMQLMAVAYGGSVERLAMHREGERTITCATESPLLPFGDHAAYFSHQDAVVEAPRGFCVDAVSEDIVSAFHSRSHHCYGVQFHPECSLGECASGVLRRFLSLAIALRIPVGDVRLSQGEYTRIAMRMGFSNINDIAKEFDVNRETVQCVWTRFRNTFDIAAILV